jgi:hypothetical protein
MTHELNLIMLAAVGIVEAIVYPWRYRAAVNGSRWENAASAFILTIMRIAFVWLGASAVMKDTPWPLALGVYAVPATLATLWFHPKKGKA